VENEENKWFNLDDQNDQNLVQRLKLTESAEMKKVKELAANWNFDVVSNFGGGHCLYLALSHAKNGDDGAGHLNLRYENAEYLEQHKNDYPIPDIDEHINNVRNNAWGDHVDIHSLHHLLEANIFIYDLHPNQSELRLVTDLQTTGYTENYRLIRTGKNKRFHYEYMEPFDKDNNKNHKINENEKNDKNKKNEVEKSDEVNGMIDDVQSIPFDAADSCIPSDDEMLQDWSCPVCSFINIGYLSTCEMCNYSNII